MQDPESECMQQQQNACMLLVFGIDVGWLFRCVSTCSIAKLDMSNLCRQAYCKLSCKGTHWSCCVLLKPALCFACMEVSLNPDLYISVLDECNKPARQTYKKRQRVPFSKYPCHHLQSDWSACCVQLRPALRSSAQTWRAAQRCGSGTTRQ